MQAAENTDGMITPEKVRDAYWRVLSTPPFNETFARIADILNDGKCRCVEAECSHADTQRCPHCGCPNPATAQQIAEEINEIVCTDPEHKALVELLALTESPQPTKE